MNYHVRHWMKNLFGEHLSLVEHWISHEFRSEVPRKA